MAGRRAKKSLKESLDEISPPILPAGCPRVEVPEEIFARWRELADDCAAGAHKHRPEDLACLHFTGYLLFDRAGRFAEAMVELEAKTNLEPPKNEEERYRQLELLFIYVFYCLQDRERGLRYLDDACRVEGLSRLRQRTRSELVREVLELHPDTVLPESAARFVVQE